ncbi:MAG: hypothetical protein AB1589_39860 [Cyanobacteriota bacterium]
MKESVGSLKAYFIVVSLLSGLGNYSLLTQWQGNTINLISGLLGMTFAIAYFYMGVSLRKLLIHCPQVITTVISISMAFIVITFLLALPYSLQITQVIRSAIGLLITWYLLINVSRLSAEERSRRGNNV